MSTYQQNWTIVLDGRIKSFYHFLISRLLKEADKSGFKGVALVTFLHTLELYHKLNLNIPFIKNLIDYYESNMIFSKEKALDATLLALEKLKEKSLLEFENLLNKGENKIGGPDTNLVYSKRNSDIVKFLSRHYAQENLLLLIKPTLKHIQNSIEGDFNDIPKRELDEASLKIYDLLTTENNRGKSNEQNNHPDLSQLREAKAIVYPTILELFKNKKSTLNSFIQIMKHHGLFNEDGKWDISNKSGVFLPIKSFLEKNGIIKKVSVPILKNVLESEFGEIMSERYFRKENHYFTLDKSLENDLSVLIKQ